MSDEKQIYREQSSEMKPEVAVLGSASLKEHDDRWMQAHTLGRLLAQAGFAIVTGGYGGLMAAVSRGAHEAGGQVIGLPMRHWTGVEPNAWNTDLRWSTDYGTRLNHILNCNAVIALPGGVGTLSEMTLTWAGSQTEALIKPLILLGECWPPLIQTIRDYFVVNQRDLSLLKFAATPEEALQMLQASLRDEQRAGPGPYG